MPTRLVLTVSLLLATPAAFAETRTWTARDGQLQVEAEYHGFSVGQVILRRGHGEILNVALEDLSENDRKFVAERVRQKETDDATERSQAPPDRIHYGPGRQLAILVNQSIDESSGLTCSRQTPGVFWTHNDSGDEARIYAFDASGRDLGSCLLADTKAWDWEDMASYTWQGKAYLLLCDIGNNRLNAKVHSLHVVEEPPVDPSAGVRVERVPVVQTIRFSYEDGPHNCEAAGIDATDRTILLVTKEYDGLSHVYLLAWPAEKSDPQQVLVARRIATLSIPFATALDISPDGRRAILVNYTGAYEYTRSEQEAWPAAFARRGRSIPVPDRLQGESVCYGPDGKTLYLTSEKLPTPLYEVPVVSSEGR
jgi:hypothetical protein